MKGTFCEAHLLQRGEIIVVAGSTRLGSSLEDALLHDSLGRFEEDNHATTSNALLEVLSLVDSAGEAVDEEGVGGLRTLDRRAQEADSNLSRDNLAICHHLIQHAALLRVGKSGLPQQVPSGEVGEAEALHKLGTEGPLACPWSPCTTSISIKPTTSTNKPQAPYPARR